MDDEDEDWIDVGHVCHSLKRSRARRALYKLLCRTYPRKMSVNELSDVTGLSLESVLGAMIGRADRFVPEDSLVSMELASCEEELAHGIAVQTFVATRRGLDMKTKLEDYRHRSTPMKARSEELLRRLKVRFRKKQP